MESEPRRTVLIVDPDAAESVAIAKSLKKLGCEPKSCIDIHSAISVAKSDRPALVISSAELLDADGFTLCDQLKSDADTKSIPVVLLCDEAQTTLADRHRESPAAADAYLFRPLSVTAILQRVAKYLVAEEPSEDEPPPESEVFEVELADVEDADVEETEVEAPEKPKRPPPPRRGATTAPEAPAASEPAAAKEPAAEEPPAAAPEPPPEAKPIEAEPDLSGMVPRAPRLPKIDLGDGEPEPHHTPTPPETVVAAEDEPTETKEAAPAVAEPPRPRTPSIAPPPRPSIPPVATPSMSPRASAKSIFPSATPSMRAGGVGTKDFLELREQLTLKEREILKLRDEMQHLKKDHHDHAERAEGLRQANLGLIEKLNERDEQLAQVETLRAQVAAALADKELAHKKGETFATKAERLKQLEAQAREELNAEKERTKALLAAHTKKLEGLAAEHSAVAERLSMESADRARKELEEERKRERAELDDALEKALIEQHDKHHGEVNELKATHEALVGELRADLQKAKERIEQAEPHQAKALEDQKKAHDEALEAERVRARDELIDARTQAKKELAKARTQADHDLEVAQSQAERQLAEVKEKLVADHAADKARTLDTLRAELERDLRDRYEKERVEALASALSKAEDKASRALAENESALRAEFDKKYADLRTSLETEATAIKVATEDRNERALAELKSAHEKELREASANVVATAKKEREELEAKLRAEKAQALVEAKAAADAELETLEKMTDVQLVDMMRERDKAREEASATKALLEQEKKAHESAGRTIKAQIDTLRETIATREIAIAKLEGDLATRTQELEKTRADLTELSARVESVEERRKRDREALDRARDSLVEAMRGVDLARDNEVK